MRKRAPLLLAVVFVSSLFSTNAFAAPTNEFRDYPIDHFVKKHFINSPYWSLPELATEKGAAVKEIRSLYDHIVDFLEKRLTEDEMYKAMIDHKDKLGPIFQQAFTRLPPDMRSGFRDPSSDELDRRLYEYRSPTVKEIRDETLWNEYLLNRNIYGSAAQLLFYVISTASVEALVVTDKSLTLPEEVYSPTQFRMYVMEMIKTLAR